MPAHRKLWPFGAKFHQKFDRERDREYIYLPGKGIGANTPRKAMPANTSSAPLLYLNATLGAACILCAAFALSCSRADPERTLEASHPVKQSNEKLPEPDCVVVVLRDLQGYLEDCGCTGDARGGVPRLPAVARSLFHSPIGRVATSTNTSAFEASSPVRFVFVGRLLSPDLERIPPDTARLIVAQLPGVVHTTAAAFGALGNVTWIPDQDEVRQLAARDLDIQELNAYRVGEPNPDTLNLFRFSMIFDVEQSKIWLNSRRTLSVDMPLKGSRATSALILAIWNADSDGGPVVVPTLLWEYDTSATNPKAFAEAASTFAANKKAVLVSRYFRPISSGFQEESRLKAIAASLAVGMYHLAGKSALKIPAQVDSAKTKAPWNACGTCHAKAVSAWNDSKHSHALVSLAEVGKHSTGVCLSCHVESISQGPGHLAVTCYSCHTASRDAQSKDGPSAACSRCHTAVTDPHAKYAAAMATICPKEVHPLAGTCDRVQKD